jgi:hypothetical protein
MVATTCRRAFAVALLQLCCSALTLSPEIADGAWFATAESCPRIMQVLYEVYTAQESVMSDDDKALEARVAAEIGCSPNSQLALADAIRCQQQYGLPLFAGWSHDFASKVRDYAWDTFM